MTASLDRSPDELRARWIPVSGDSMWPVLRSGDEVRCERIAGQATGTIVVAKLSRGLVAHRVVGWAEGSVLLRGDNVGAHDELISEACVLGQVVRVRRGGRVHELSALDSGPSMSGRVRLRMKQLTAAGRSRLTQLTAGARARSRVTGTAASVRPASQLASSHKLSRLKQVASAALRWSAWR